MSEELEKNVSEEVETPESACDCACNEENACCDGENECCDEESKGCSKWKRRVALIAGITVGLAIVAAVITFFMKRDD